MAHVACTCHVTDVSPPPPLGQIMSDRFAGRMSAKDASIFAWSFGMLGLRTDRLVRVLTREGLATIGEATPHDLSNLAWGLARAGVGAVDMEITGEDREGMACSKGDGRVQVRPLCIGETN